MTKKPRKIAIVDADPNPDPTRWLKLMMEHGAAGD
jgi:hypothetical protein